MSECKKPGCKNQRQEGGRCPKCQKFLFCSQTCLLTSSEHPQHCIENRCANCGATPASGDTRFEGCGDCKQVRYCSKDCQVRHWFTEHKQSCEDMGIQRLSQASAQGAQPAFDLTPSKCPGCEKPLVEIIMCPDLRRPSGYCSTLCAARNATNFEDMCSTRKEYVDLYLKYDDKGYRPVMRQLDSLWKPALNAMISKLEQTNEFYEMHEYLSVLYQFFKPFEGMTQRDIDLNNQMAAEMFDSDRFYSCIRKTMSNQCNARVHTSKSLHFRIAHLLTQLHSLLGVNVFEQRKMRTSAIDFTPIIRNLVSLQNEIRTEAKPQIKLLHLNTMKIYSNFLHLMLVSDDEVDGATYFNRLLSTPELATTFARVISYIFSFQAPGKNIQIMEAFEVLTEIFCHIITNLRQYHRPLYDRYFKQIRFFNGDYVESIFHTPSRF